jgi:nucleotide-binding universal stress UspA family protein
MNALDNERRPQFRSVLLVTDDAHASERAFHWALAVAQQNAAFLHVVGILHSFPLAADFLLEGTLDYEEAKFSRRMAHFKEGAATRHIYATTEIIFGIPDDLLTVRVASRHVDLIVTPQGSFGSWWRQWSRSIAQQLPDHRSVLVMTVNDAGVASIVA